MTDSRLPDFFYPGEDEPDGVVERELSADVIAVIDAVADDVRRSLDAFSGRRMDCRHACSAWERALKSQGLAIRAFGGEGVDDDSPSSDFRIAPLDRRTGYREGDRTAIRSDALTTYQAPLGGGSDVSRRC
jgi:hypothetical protein